MKILLASNNKHKLKEIVQIFNDYIQDEYTLFTPSMLSIDADIEETGTTLKENALIKASFFADISRIATISDDTGLEVDALNGEPGVYSARFSGIHGDDAANRKKLLLLMKNVPSEKRTARFRTVVCYANGDANQFFEGICEGIITEAEKGNNGFGYDSIFIPLGFSQTFAEMELSEKNKLSHRKKAVTNLAEFLSNSIKK